MIRPDTDYPFDVQMVLATTLMRAHKSQRLSGNPLGFVVPPCDSIFSLEPKLFDNEPIFGMSFVEMFVGVVLMWMYVFFVLCGCSLRDVDWKSVQVLDAQVIFCKKK